MPGKVPNVPMMMTRLFGLFASLSSNVGIAWSHPGHGTAGGSHTASHYLTSPDHWAVPLSALLVMWAVVHLIRKWRRSQRGLRQEASLL